MCSIGQFDNIWYLLQKKCVLMHDGLWKAALSCGLVIYQQVSLLEYAPLERLVYNFV